jgi:hypothetical protein
MHIYICEYVYCGSIIVISIINKIWNNMKYNIALCIII